MLKDLIKEDKEHKSTEKDVMKKTRYYDNFVMAQDRKSLIIVQNRVVAILDIGKAPTNMIWAFDLKQYK